LIKYNIEFEVLGEIRMGSPYNGANVKLSGDFVPELGDFTFQDIYLVSENGRTCYLVQLAIDKDPGFIVWKIDADNNKVTKSSRIEGCCDSLFYDNESIKTVAWNWDPIKKAEIRNELEVRFTDS
jgi:hypothetical protein